MKKKGDGSLLHPRHLGGVALVAIVLFAVACTTAQGLRSDLDWVRAPLSFYLLGEYGWLVKGAYFALAAALVSLGIGYYRALAYTARSGAPRLLFVTGGAALAVTAVAEAGPGSGDSLETVIHVVAAGMAFLCVTVAMLLQSVRMRHDTAWRGRFLLAFCLGAACFAAMWIHALWREVPRGLSQKVVIALILAWLGLAAWWLQQHRPQLQPATDSEDSQ